MKSLVQIYDKHFCKNRVGSHLTVQKISKSGVGAVHVKRDYCPLTNVLNDQTFTILSHTRTYKNLHEKAQTFRPLMWRVGLIKHTHAHTKICTYTHTQ